MDTIAFIMCNIYMNDEYNNGFYDSVKNSFDSERSDVNPFERETISYSGDATTTTHHLVFNNTSSFTIRNVDIVEYWDEFGMEKNETVACSKTDGNNQSEFIWNFSDSIVGYRVDIYLIETVSPATYTIIYSISDSEWANKVSISPLSPIEVEKGKSITVQVSPLSGYYFSGTDKCQMFIMETLEYIPFHLSSDGNMYLEMDDGLSDNTLSLEFTVTVVEVDPPISNKRTNFYTVYAPTDENMKKINNTVFIGNQEVIGKFISYKKFWCVIPTDGIAEMKAGNYDFNFDSPVIHESILDIDCGTVTVDEKYHSVLDYSPFSRLTLFLPFIGFVDLDDKMAMNNNVRVNYRVDVLSGRCLAEVHVMLDETSESCIATYAGTIATDEPFMQGLNTYKGTYELMTSMQLGELTPFIIVNTLVPLDTGDVNLDGLPTEEIKKVGDCSGYIQYSFINASGCRGTDAEKTEIENLLKSGVNVNTVE